MRTRRASVAVALSALVCLSGAAVARAELSDLTPGAVIDDNPATGIEPGALSPLFDGSSAATGGALAAGARRSPWVAFASADQIFVRAFSGGRWVTQGHGTLGGLSSDSPPASSSLNLSDAGDAEQPSIDFAGPGRTVPWTAWSERDPGAPARIFASRFHPPGTATDADRWEFAGQNRSSGDDPALPSLNLHTDRDARDPAVAGGSIGDTAAPGPWVAWRETGAHAPGTGVDQVFVARPSAPGAAGCDPSVRLGDQTGGKGLGETCFGQVGAERLGSDTSLNVDRTRPGGDPDIAFAGAGDAVPWVVWREHGPTQVNGLHDNAMIFAAKGVAPPAGSQGTTDGGLRWVVVGQDAQGTLDGDPAGGPCATDGLAEELCSLNENLLAEAGPPRLATGTVTPGAATVPWVVWSENGGGGPAIFATRLVGSGADARFEPANRGRPLAAGTLPDIAFAGTTPYVTWVGTDHTVHSGHFADPGRFVADHISDSASFQRAALASTCAADPFSADGSSCPGGVLGTPFTVFDDAAADGATVLRGATYPAGAPDTGGATAITDTAATVGGVVTPQGARTQAFFEFGPTTAYGSRSAAFDVVSDGGPVAFDERLTGLAPGTTIHYRLVDGNDLLRADGADASFVSAGAPAPSPPPDPPPAADPPRSVPPPAVPPPPPAVAPHVRFASRVHVGRHDVSVRVAADAPADVKLHGTLTGRSGGRRRMLALGSARARYSPPGSRTLRIRFSGRAARALERLRSARITVVAEASGPGGRTTVRVTVPVR